MVWTCHACTLENENDAYLSCAVCGTTRAAETDDAEDSRKRQREETAATPARAEARDGSLGSAVAARGSALAARTQRRENIGTAAAPLGATRSQSLVPPSLVTPESEDEEPDDGCSARCGMGGDVGDDLLGGGRGAEKFTAPRSDEAPIGVGRQPGGRGGGGGGAVSRGLGRVDAAVDAGELPPWLS